MVECTSGKRSLAHVDMESACESRASKRAKITADLNPDISTNGKSPIELPSALYESKNTSFEKCSTCSKPQSMLNCSEDQALCSCNARTRRKLCISPSEPGGEFEELGDPDSTESGRNACAVCKGSGLLLFCRGKGCKRSYHLSCLDPPFKDAPPGVWYCLLCAKKKIESGVYSVSEGIESILNYKEELPNEQHYFVKYKGLAHVHNRWIPHGLLLVEAPTLLAKYRKRQICRWKKEWTEPHRVLLKRYLISSGCTERLSSGHSNNFPSCSHEWLVKWKGLDYEHCTWEHENSSFLCSPEGLLLIKDYERWREEAKKAYEPSTADKALSVKSNPFCELLSLPDRWPRGLDCDYLDSTNMLREFWHKSQSAVIIDDQERIVKSILFILSLMCDTWRPFLIITTLELLSLWEAEFARLVPAINLVVYNGNKNTRKFIQNLEFYDDGGCRIFQVLLSHPKAIVEDLDSFEWITWEAVIVDECQQPKVSTRFEQLKQLSSDFRLLLVNGLLKDDFAEYLSLLSFLDPNLKFDSNGSEDLLVILKERLSYYIVFEHKARPSKFVEYLLPAHLSTMQLKQYCHILASNSLALCSQYRENVETLHNILISTRKCCDHPYLVDDGLRSSLVNDHMGSECLEHEVNASGKLRLLDQMLQEVKSRGLRVLILFQPFYVARKISIGDILDDFLHERYGPDSYERIDRGMIRSKKQASLNMFNDKACGRFVLLVETKACGTSIKLSSLDAVIMFNSDWNPHNDSKALQKIIIDSKDEIVRVFRLYSSYTVEEKILNFLKQNTGIESNVENISFSTSHSMLGWGAPYLFRKFNEPDQHDMSSQFETSTGISLGEFFESVLQIPNADDTDTGNQTTEANVETSCARNVFLDDENEAFATLDDDPSNFWSRLLQRDFLICGSSQQNSVDHGLSDEAVKVPAKETEIGEKHTEFSHYGGGMTNFLELNPIVNKLSVPSIDVSESSMHEGISNSIPSDREELEEGDIIGNQSTILVTNEPEPLMNERNSEISLSSYDELDGEIRKITDNHDCPEQLVIPEHGTYPVGEILVAETEHCVEPLMDASSYDELEEGEIQKFTDTHDSPEQLVMMEHGADPLGETPVAETEHCVEPLMDASSYDELEEGEIQKFTDTHDSPQQPVMTEHGADPVGETPVAETEQCVEPLMNASHYDELEKCEMRNFTDTHECPEQLVLMEHGVDPVGETPVAETEHCVEPLMDELLNKKIGLIDEICSRRLAELILRQKQQVDEFKTLEDNERLCMMKSHDLDLDLIRAGDGDQVNKMKVIRDKIAKEMYNLDQHIKRQRRKLAVIHIDARNKEKQIKDILMEEAKAGKLAEFFDNLPMPDSTLMVEEFMFEGWRRASRPQSSADTCKRSFGTQSVSSIGMETVVTSTDATEPCRPTAESLKIVFLGSEGNMPIQTETSAQAENTDVFDNVLEGVNCSGTTAICVPIVGMEDMQRETRVRSADAAEPCRPSAESVKMVSLESEDNMPLLTETSARSENTTIFDNVLEGKNCSDSDGLHLTSPLQSERNAISLAQGSGNSGGEMSASPDQVLHVTRQERPAISDGLVNDQGFSSVTVHPIVGGSSQVVPSQDDSLTPNTVSFSQVGPSEVPSTISFQPPSSVSLASVLNGDMCTSGPARTEQENWNQLQSSYSDALTEQPALAISAAQPTPQPANFQRERRSEYPRVIDVRPDTGCHLPPIFPVLQPMPRQGLNLEPLEKEIMLLQKQENLFKQIHEDKKLQLGIECEKEIEKIRMKYDTLIQDVDAEFLQKKTKLDAICSKVLINQSLAERFSATFEVRGTTVTSRNPSWRSLPSRPPQPSQQQLSQIPTSRPPQPSQQQLSQIPTLLGRLPNAPPSTPAPVRAINRSGIVINTQPNLPFGNDIPYSHYVNTGPFPAPHLGSSRGSVPASVLNHSVGSMQTAANMPQLDQANLQAFLANLSFLGKGNVL